LILSEYSGSQAKLDLGFKQTLKCSTAFRDADLRP